MHRKLEQQIRKDFPGLFPAGSEKVEIAVGDGWFDILYFALSRMALVTPRIQIMCIKEKFGDLTILFSGWEPRKWWQIWRLGERNPWKIAVFAARQAQTICEWCGQPGYKDSDGWIKVLCPKHRRLWIEGKRWWLDDDLMHRKEEY